MQFSEIFIRRPVMTIAINLVLLILGLVSFHHLELRHTPNVTRSEICVTTIFPGANSSTVEYQVTKPLEDALAGLDGIKKLNSTTQDSRSEIHIKFKVGIDTHKALSQVRDRVLAATSVLPESVKRPEIQEQAENNSAILYLRFEDKTQSIAALSDYIRRVIEARLTLIEGVAKVGHFGDEQYMIAITPDPALLAKFQVTIKDVVDALRRENTHTSGGEIEGVTGSQSVVLMSSVKKPQDFANITVKKRLNERITIDNVATISITQKPTYLKIRVNGNYIVGLEILAKSNANPLQVAKRVYHFVEDLKRTLPDSIKVSISFDATKAFSEAFINMRYTLWEGIILVGIIITLSLGSIRAAFLPMITVPLCLIGSFALMWILDFSINPITLLSLILAIGLVVDDAIVVVENIYRHMEEGLTSLDAAKRSMKEISFSVVVMTVTLAAVYVPLLFQADDAAIIFREFAWTLAGSVVISGFVALTLTPALGAKFLKESKKIHYWDIMATHYRMLLTIAIEHPRAICFTLFLIILLGTIGFQKLPSELVPIEDQGYLQGSISAKNSVTLEIKESWFKNIETILKNVPEAELTVTGIWQDQWMWWSLLLKPNKERNRTSQEIAKTLKPRLKSIIGPEVDITDNQNFASEEPLKIILQYNGDQRKLLKALNSIIIEARKYPEFDVLKCEENLEKKRLEVILDRELVNELGINVDVIEDTLYTLLSGRKVTNFNFEGLDYDVQVRAPKKLRSELSSLNSYFVANNEGQWASLGSVATLKETIGLNQIKHYDRMRGTEVVVSLQSGVALDDAMKILDPIIKKYLPVDAHYQFGGKAEQFKESRDAMWLTFALALVFIYLVLAALFESFIHPFVVLLTVPLSITGAVWTINWVNGTNNVYTIIGLVTLIGLITKHGILIVDFANRLRTQDRSLKNTILTAAELRLRPILMTTFAMVCGAIPLLFSVGAGAVAKKHIGWVIIGGMLMGTGLSLFVVPVIYSLIERIRVREKF